MFKIYMDESGTHDGSPIVTVAAYIARPLTWKAFTNKWNAKKKPIKVFHSSECNGFKGEFEGWERAARDALVIRLTEVMRTHNMMGFVTGLDLRSFEKAMAENPELKEMLPSPYGACFHWTIGNVMRMLDGKTNERLAFFHEINDYEDDAKDAFKFIRENRVHHKSGMTLSFGGKDDFVPLQAADILAYEGFKLLQNPKARRRPSLEAMGSNLNISWYGPDNMPDLVNRLKLSNEQIKTFGRVF